MNTTFRIAERRSWSGKRTALVVAGSILALLGTTALASGGIALWADQQRDGDGFFTAGPGRFSTDTYAISAPSVHIDADGPDALYEEDMLGKVRIQLRPADADASLFVGVGRTADVAAYLDRVGHDEVSDLDTGPFSVTYSRHTGGQPGTAPAAQTFWTATDAGAGPRTLTWPVSSGDWTVVMMNTDATAGVQADVTAGATLPIMRNIAIVALVCGVVLLGGGVAMIVAPVATRGPRRRLPAGPTN